MKLPVKTILENYTEWLSNNWFIPVGYDGMWKINFEDPECEEQRVKDILGFKDNDVNLFSPKELMTMYLSGVGIS